VRKLACAFQGGSKLPHSKESVDHPYSVNLLKSCILIEQILGFRIGR
jgi:hypothetical protein